jgi:hypothetical protein
VYNGKYPTPLEGWEIISVDVIREKKYEKRQKTKWKGGNTKMKVKLKLKRVK